MFEFLKAYLDEICYTFLQMDFTSVFKFGCFIFIVWLLTKNIAKKNEEHAAKERERRRIRERQAAAAEAEAEKEILEIESKAIEDTWRFY